MTNPLGHRLKLGIVTPSVNTIVQPEYDDMRPYGVTNHVARIHIPEKPIVDDAGFKELVDAIDGSLDEAVEQVLTCSPDAVVMGVSIEAVYGGGLAAARAIERRLEKKFGDVRLVHAAAAIPAALAAMGVHDGGIGLLTPYMPDADSHLRAFMDELGYEVTDAVHLQAPTPLLIAHTPEKDLRAGLTRLAAGQPRAIVQFGANLCMGRLAGEAERWLGLPVIAVNTATYWHALRSNGIMDKRPGFGCLMLEH